VVESYLEACRERGITVARLAHGRGKGVRRAEVRRLLARLPAVESFRDADPGAGGWGATLVTLRGAESHTPQS
jgi:DNA-nicking Smr family endonuclease